MPTIPDYLVIGHVCQDIISAPGHGRLPLQTSTGGTVTYAARTARALGLHVAALTSAAPDFALSLALPDIQVHRLPSDLTTTFENRYHHGVRQQILHNRSGDIRVTDVPASWRQAKIVHLGPVAREVDLALVEGFPDAFVGVTPQGWLRTWDERGYVRPRVREFIYANKFSTWKGPNNLEPWRVDAIVFSIEDIGGDESLIAEWTVHAPVVVVTRGERGATLYVQNEARHVHAPRVHEVEPTGAGDIFAAAFFVRLRETGDPDEAARFATRLASTSVTRRGLESIPTAAEVEAYRSNSIPHLSPA